MLITLKELCAKPSTKPLLWRTRLMVLLIVIAGCDNDYTYICPTLETIEDFPWVADLMIHGATLYSRDRYTIAGQAVKIYFCLEEGSAGMPHSHITEYDLGAMHLLDRWAPRCR